ncbi:MAG: pitrilysin family protein [bacterium]
MNSRISCCLGAGLFVLAICLTATPAGSETPRHPADLDLSPLTFERPEPVRTELPCGIPVLLFENHDLPLVTVTARLQMGTRYLAPDRHTACHLLSRLWKDGGTKSQTPEELEAREAALGITLQAWVGSMIGYVSVSLVSQDLPEALPLWRDLLRRPGFAAERLERAKDRMLKDVQAINDNPDRLADLYFARLLFGEHTPGAHEQTRAGIEAVDEQEIRALYSGFVRPEHAVIGVAGDFDPDEIVAQLERLLGDWTPMGDPLPREPYTWTPQSRPGVYLVPAEFEQSQIRIGYLVPEMTTVSPDYPAVRILEFALGYGRVFYRTRGDGLSYGTGTLFEVGEDFSRFYGTGSTGHEKVDDLIAAVREEVNGLRDTPLSAPEVEMSRTFVVGTVVQDCETAREVVVDCIDNMLRDRPADYAEAHLTGLQKTTVDEIGALADLYCQFGDSTVILVIGDPEQVSTPLAELNLGEVIRLDLERFGE